MGIKTWNDINKYVPIYDCFNMHFILNWNDIAGKYDRRYSPMSSYSNYFIHQLNGLQWVSSPPVFGLRYINIHTRFQRFALFVINIRKNGFRLSRNKTNEFKIRFPKFDFILKLLGILEIFNTPEEHFRYPPQFLVYRKYLWLYNACWLFPPFW